MTNIYSKPSPYYKTPINGNYLDVANIQNIPALESDVEFVVTKQYEHRPDLLAYDLYGDTRLWWVFSIRNKNIIKDPIYDLVAGLRIQLPSLSTLRSALGV